MITYDVGNIRGPKGPREWAGWVKQSETHLPRALTERLAKIFYIFLKRMDLSAFDITHSPKTEAYKKMILSQID
jgi:hypothetical protein